jgi:putative transposase
MKNLLNFIFALVFALIKILSTKGRKSLVAENLILRQELHVMTRGSVRSPQLTIQDKLVYGVLTNFISKSRLSKLV